MKRNRIKKKPVRIYSTDDNRFFNVSSQLYEMKMRDKRTLAKKFFGNAFTVGVGLAIKAR